MKNDEIAPSMQYMDLRSRRHRHRGVFHSASYHTVPASCMGTFDFDMVPRPNPETGKQRLIRNRNETPAVSASFSLRFRMRRINAQRKYPLTGHRVHGILFDIDRRSVHKKGGSDA